MKKHRLISMLCAVSVSLTLFLPFSTANAFDEATTENRAFASNAEEAAFVNYISTFFENPDEYRVIDVNGNDISNSFFSRNYATYKAENFAELKFITDQEVAWIEQVGANIAPFSGSAATETLTTSTWLAYISNITMNFEFAVTMSGEYQYNSSSGQITSGEYPNISLYYYQYPDQATITFTNIVKMRPNITNNGQNIEFNIQFAVYRTLEGWTPIYCGTFTGRIVGDIQGGEPIEYDPIDYGYPID